MGEQEYCKWSLTHFNRSTCINLLQQQHLEWKRQVNSWEFWNEDAVPLSCNFSIRSALLKKYEQQMDCCHQSPEFFIFFILEAFNCQGSRQQAEGKCRLLHEWYLNGAYDIENMSFINYIRSVLWRQICFFSWYIVWNWAYDKVNMICINYFTVKITFQWNLWNKEVRCVKHSTSIEPLKI